MGASSSVTATGEVGVDVGRVDAPRAADEVGGDDVVGEHLPDGALRQRKVGGERFGGEERAALRLDVDGHVRRQMPAPAWTTYPNCSSSRRVRRTVSGLSPVFHTSVLTLVPRLWGIWW